MLINMNLFQVVTDEISHLVDNQKQLESKFETIVDTKHQLQGKTRSAIEKQDVIKRDIHQIGSDLKNSTHVFARSVKQSPLTTDNLEKVQADRYVLF